MMRWGLVPHFTKGLKDFRDFSTINARAEGIMNSPTWRRPFKRRRCLIPADGFYEWKKLDAKTKQPLSTKGHDGSVAGSTSVVIDNRAGTLPNPREYAQSYIRFKL
jgi:putative SOS response-associated peptidase YedK